jgi:hypothetical protein
MQKKFVAKIFIKIDRVIIKKFITSQPATKECDAKNAKCSQRTQRAFADFAASLRPLHENTN